MGRKRGKTAKEERAKRLVAEGYKASVSEVYNDTPPDPPLALLAVHPKGVAVAVAVGTHLRVFDKRDDKVEQSSFAEHKLPIRAVAFDGSGRFMLTGSDDKGLRVWSTASWQLLHTMYVPKKISAATFSACGTYAICADNIVTSLTPSPDGKFLVSTDRDHKVRATVFPARPYEGAHDIQSYCLGHSAFVKCAAFVSAGGVTRLVLGGGDGTVRLWDHVHGKQLARWDLPVPEKEPEDEADEPMLDGDVSEGALHLAENAELSTAAAVPAEEVQALDKDEAPLGVQAEGDDEAQTQAVDQDEHEDQEGDQQAEDSEDMPVAYALAASPDGRTIAVAIEGKMDIALLECDLASSALSHRQQLTLPGSCPPTQLHFDAQGNLWAVAGPPQEESTTAFLAVAFKAEGSQEFGFRPADALPERMQAALECRTETRPVDASDRAVDGKPAVVLSTKTLRKRMYGDEPRERKKGRRDIRDGYTLPS
ncbi:hypothetical protein WJX72_000693 [[Myrmecia] bisecta]|uniref:WD repeat-containing protein 4 homolog n=1 Tax=[Myrmecia] bisecta TaxID=41462 RepID=A0AAW1R4S2_9CHLO